MKINSIQVSYGMNKVIDSGYIDFETSGITGILGLNGAGKTTFFKAVMGLVPGQISGMNMTNISYFPDDQEYYNQRVSFLLQLLEITHRDFNKERAITMLSKVQISESDAIRSLSRGQKVLLNVCITLSRNCDTYFLDELYSNLDFETRELITSLLIEFVDVKKKQVLISSHEISDIERVIDQVVVLHQARFHPVKKTDDVIQKYGSVYQYFEHVVLEGGR